MRVDPDPQTRLETRSLLDGPEDRLRERFGGRLAFGTAGMRAPMGTGPMRMNRVMMRLLAAALAQRLQADSDDSEAGDKSAEPTHVLIGRDARRLSAEMAGDAAGILAHRGVRVTLFDSPVPTPVMAYGTRRLAADAGLMVTASHNPRPDNGCKPYWRPGTQLCHPIDAEISDLIDTISLEAISGDLPPTNSELVACFKPLIALADQSLHDGYLRAAVGVLSPDGHRSAKIAYTPLHGVGAHTFTRAAVTAGFPAPMVVPDQAKPDPGFPTTQFPNPEEPGVLDRLLRLAKAEGADVALANDPDADRLAVAVPHQDKGWRVLTGDDVGCLLAEYLLTRNGRGEHQRGDDGAPTARRGLLVSTVVSSRLLGLVAEAHGVDWVETLTGFKWVMKACTDRAQTHDLVLAYEDALGYATGDQVLDKDGISSGLLVAEMVSTALAEGRTLPDMLDDLHLQHGVHVNGQRSIRFDTPTSDQPRPSVNPTDMTAKLRAHPPSQLGDLEVIGIVDLAEGGTGLPATDALILQLQGARVVVRPSGTEPKIKIYAEATANTTTRAHLPQARQSAQATLRAALTATTTQLTAP